MFGSVVTQLPLSSTELLRREPDFLSYLPLSVNRNTSVAVFPHADPNQTLTEQSRGRLSCGHR